MALLDDVRRDHQIVRPDHDPDPKPAERDRQQHALDLGLAAQDVHAQQCQRR